MEPTKRLETENKSCKLNNTAFIAQPRNYRLKFSHECDPALPERKFDTMDNEMTGWLILIRSRSVCRSPVMHNVRLKQLLEEETWQVETRCSFPRHWGIYGHLYTVWVVFVCFSPGLKLLSYSR